MAKTKKYNTPVGEMVETVLRNVPESRNSDITLMIEIWLKYFNYKVYAFDKNSDCVKLEDLYLLPREDSIKRERAKLNAQGKYYPTDWNIAKHRGLKEDEWRIQNNYPAKADTVRPTKTDSYMDQQRDFNRPKLF